MVMKREYSLQEVDLIANYLKKLIVEFKIFTFTAPLGAGKTTLIRSLLQCMGVVDPITSPTFSYMNEYKTSGLTIYHFDLYRIETIHDFMAAGFHEYLYEPESVCLIEWPQVIMPLLNQGVCHCSIEYGSEEQRLFACSCI